MILKYKSNTVYNLVITILISLLMLMLYLGNYNLIEGNYSQQEVITDLNSLSEKNKNMRNGLQDNKLYKSGCLSMEQLNAKNSDYIKERGGTNSIESKSIQSANQALATVCSNNSQLNI